MGWILDLLLGKDDGKTPRYGAAQEEPDPIDWRKLEDCLVQVSERTVLEFAGRHPSESFYGFGFDCESSEGQVLLCFNSREGQTEAARRVEGPYKEVLLAKTEDERASSIEWGFGELEVPGHQRPVESLGQGMASRKDESGGGAFHARDESPTGTSGTCSGRIHAHGVPGTPSRCRVQCHVER